MENSKNSFLYIIIVLVILANVLSPFWSEFISFEDMQLNPFDYARITDVEYKAVVQDEPENGGSILVTERLTFDIHAASKSNLFWELWRDLPEDYEDNLKVYYNVLSVKQILPDGREIEYKESPVLYWEDEDYVSSNKILGPGKWYHSEGPYNEDSRDYECVFFYVDGLYREEVVFELVYEMKNASMRYNDCSELYLSLYSEGTINYLESFKADILFPEKDMPSQGNYEAYTYGTNKHSFPFEESDTKYPGYHTFSFDLDKKDLKFKPYNQYIEFDLFSYNEDKHVFTENAPDNRYSYDNVLQEIHQEQHIYESKPAVYLKTKLIILAVSLVSGVLILLFAFGYKKRIRRKYIFFEPSSEAEFYRDIPSDLDPSFAADLVFCKEKAPRDNSGIYSALLLSLVRKNYIKLEELDSGDVKILLKYRFPKQPTPDTGSTILERLAAEGPIMRDIPDEEMTLSSVGTGTFSTPDTIPLDSPEPEIIENPREPLTLCEQYYFDLITHHTCGNEITMNTLQYRIANDYENTDTFALNMANSTKNIGLQNRFFQKAFYEEPKYAVLREATSLRNIGLFCLILVNLISSFTPLGLAFGGYTIIGICSLIGAFYLKRNSVKYILLTQSGEDEYVKWRGLYNFLNSDTLIKDRTYLELPIWEKYLIYATAFGLSQKVIDAIRIRCPERVSSPILSSNYCNSGRIHHSGRTFHSSIRRGVSTARAHGGGGGYSGYGGGGRGGGGGGGGH